MKCSTAFVYTFVGQVDNLDIYINDLPERAGIV